MFPDKVPDKVGAGEAAGVDAPRIGRLKKRRSTVDSQSRKGPGTDAKAGRQGRMTGLVADCQRTYYHMITVAVKEKLETTCKWLVCWELVCWEIV